jgi:hypothetical protein
VIKTEIDERLSYPPTQRLSAPLSPIQVALERLSLRGIEACEELVDRIRSAR